MGKRNRASRRRVEIDVAPAHLVLVPKAPSTEVRRSFDASDINPILNDPAVFPLVSVPGIERFDVSDVVADPRNALLMADGGGVLFKQQEPGIYEVHTNFLPTFRGRHAIRASQNAYRWMFLNTDCMVLQSFVPAFNRAAEFFCRMVGATLEFERKACWPSKDGPVDASFWSIRYEDWVRKADGLVEASKIFHEKMDAEFLRHGAPRHSHPEEECHDRYAGVCIEMVYAGQPEKAIVLYNRWARFSGHGEMKMIALNPLMIDIGDALLQILDRSFKVVKCHG